KTKDLLKKVVVDMSLNVKYYKKGQIRDVEYYEPPFSLVFLNEADTIRTTNFVLVPLSDKKFSLIADNIDTVAEFDKPINIKRIGLFQIHRNASLSNKSQYSLLVRSIDAEVASLKSNINVVSTNKQVTIIDISMKHAIPKKGEDI